MKNEIKYQENLMYGQRLEAGGLIVFHYDKTFEGLLTAVFEAYSRRTYPHRLLGVDELEPLFVDESFRVMTDEEKSGRVWKALEKKLERNTLNMIS